MKAPRPLVKQGKHKSRLLEPTPIFLNFIILPTFLCHLSCNSCMKIKHFYCVKYIFEEGEGASSRVLVMKI